MKMVDISQISTSQLRVRYLDSSPALFFHFSSVLVAEIKPFLLQKNASNRNLFPLVVAVVDAASAIHEADNGPDG